MIISSNKNPSCKHILKTNGTEITSELSVTLHGIEVDDKLNFDEHFSNLCIKVSRHLNAIFGLQSYMNKKENETITNSFL